MHRYEMKSQPMDVDDDDGDEKEATAIRPDSIESIRTDFFYKLNLGVSKCRPTGKKTFPFSPPPLFVVACGGSMHIKHSSRWYNEAAGTS